MKRILLFLLCLYSLISKAQVSDKIVVSETSSEGYFTIVSSTAKACVIVDANDAECVRIAAEKLCDDIEMLTGKKPEIANEVPETDMPVIIIGTIGKSRFITDGNGIETSNISGKWETFCLQQSETGNKNALFIYGSDPRGTAFGVFELSRAMGIHPWYWWADVSPAHKDELFVNVGKAVFGPPSVKYRGLFINDEDWGMQPWAAENIDTDIKDIGPATYEKFFELMLRMKANYLWPAMHPCTKAFWWYKGNPEMARRYGIVLGSSHCEPLLRNNVDEWQNNFEAEYGTSHGDWNWKTNSATITKYWEDRVVESKNNDAIYTVGMRGIHDSSMPGYSTIAEKASALKEVIGTQRGLLEDNLGKNAGEIPQIFCPYKEALTLYRTGIDLPEDVTLLWADDNFGYVRQYSDTEEQKRSGGAGVYYHFSYWGVPCDHLWLSSVSPTLTSYELSKAYDLNCKDVWIFNIGDLKPQEKEAQFAMDFAWDVKRWSPDKAYGYIETWAEEIFGEELSKEIADIQNTYYYLAASGKPEHIQKLSFSESEMKTRIKDYDRIERQCEELAARIPERLKDAYYELIEYPVVGASCYNKKVLYGKLSFEAASKGMVQEMEDYSSKALLAYEKIIDTTNKYNTMTANGKWNKMMDYAPRGLSQFYEPSVATVNNLPSEVVVYKETPDSIVRITGCETKSLSDAAKFLNIKGLGVADNSLTIYPLDKTTYSTTADAPYAEYEIPVRKGTNNITVKCLPCFPIDQSHNLRFATSINGSAATIHNIKMEAEASPWSTNVMTGYSYGTTEHTAAADGTAVLRIYFMEPAIVVSEIDVKLAKEQSEYTSLMTNPDFEYRDENTLANGNVVRGDVYGWKRTGELKGNSYGLSSDATGYSGKSICWYNSTPMPDYFELSQTIEGIPAGKYIVRCKLGVFNTQVTNQRLFANNKSQYYGTENDYGDNIDSSEDYTFAGHAFGAKDGSKAKLYEMAVKVELTENEPLTVGIKSSNLLANGQKATNNAGWFKVDDFRIEPDSIPVDTLRFDIPEETVIVNANFEKIDETTVNDGSTKRGYPYGWEHQGELAGNSYGINNDAVNYSGNNVSWFYSKPMPDCFELYQTVEGLKGGLYKLSCLLCVKEGSLTTQCLFANENIQYFGHKEDYGENIQLSPSISFANWNPSNNYFLKQMTVYVTLQDNEPLRLGIRTGNKLKDGSIATNEAGWFKVDDFRLEYIGPSLTLDQNATMLDAENGHYAAVSVNRNMEADKWNTLVLPFSMSVPEGWEVKELSDDTWVDNNGTMHLRFSAAEAISTGQPYMVRVTEPVNGLYIRDVDVDMSSSPVQKANGIDFVGVYTGRTIPSGAFFVNNNTFYHAINDKNNIKGYRAYLQLSPESRAKTIECNIDGITTDINSIIAPDTTHDVYDIQGIHRKIMTKGMNIVRTVDGKMRKIVIK